jgi:hypothetical protein
VLHATSAESIRAYYESQVRAAATAVYRPEGVDIWMNAANPSLNGATPMQSIAAGNGERVLQVIDQLASGAFG